MNPNEGKERRRFLLFLLPVFLGTLFGLWYIHSAACDVVYSDYIRLIDSYLPDVTNPAKFFVPDVLTRIPAAFLQRIVNVRLFAFSVTFDRVCALFGLFLCGAVLAGYVSRERISPAIYLCIMAVLFSLIKWEILLNGTAWAHVVSFGLFFWNYAVLDRVFQEKERRADCLLLCILPFFILLFAGEYIAAYTGGLVIAYAYCMFWGRRRCEKISAGCRDQGAARVQNSVPDTVHMPPRWGFYLLCSVLPLFLYLLSRHFAVWEHAGATSLSFSEAMAAEPLFLPRFFVKTFAGAVFGQETLAALSERGLIGDGGVLLIGLLVIAAYLFAIFLYMRARLYEKTLFPMILLLTGGMNHVLVTASRWIFLKESYALSSRYAAQFMIGIIGILLILGLWLRERRDERKHFLCKGILSLFCIFFLAGNCYTSWDEIKKAPYREQNYEELSVMLRDYRAYSEEALRKGLEWNKSAETMYHALSILEQNHLNVFRK